jgi:hypothetical protein
VCPQRRMRRALIFPTVGAALLFSQASVSATVPQTSADQSASVGAPGSHAHRHAVARPTVRAMSASPSALTAAGGRVTLTATVRHARKCSIVSVPALPGLPHRADCSGGHLRKRIDLPRDSGHRDSVFRIRLTARRAGRQASRTVRVVVGEVVPSGRWHGRRYRLGVRCGQL